MKNYEELDLTDNFLFFHIMEKYPDLCKEIIELAIGRKVTDIIVHAQEFVKYAYSSKGIGIDIRVESEEAWYSVEMQNTKTDDIPKRARYYHSTTDMACLNKGAHYSELKPNYGIFICNFDLFKCSYPIYTIKKIIKEVPNGQYTDGQYTIFLNTNYSFPNNADSKILNFLDYIKGKTICGTLAQKLESAVLEAKNNDIWRQSYMDIRQLEIGWQLKARKEGVEIGKAEGKAEGRAEGRIETIMNLVDNNLISISNAAKFLNLTEDELVDQITRMKEQS